MHLELIISKRYDGPYVTPFTRVSGPFINKVKVMTLGSFGKDTHTHTHSCMRMKGNLYSFPK